MSYYHQSHAPLVLRGDFAGKRDANLHYRFRFCDDGVYYYSVEQTGHWRLCHRGRFIVSETADLNNPMVKHHVAALKPLRVDLDPQQDEAYAMLSAHGLPLKDPQQYFIMLFEAPHPLNPAIVLQDWTFSVPNLDGTTDVSWSMSPAVKPGT